MISREQVEAILKVNGVPETSPDEHIRSVLLSARYSNDEVDAAIMILRENDKTKKTRVDGLHKVFRTSDALSSDEISQLLGVDVTYDRNQIKTSRTRKATPAQVVIIWMMSILIATIAVLVYMYVYRVGVFHPALGFGVL